MKETLLTILFTLFANCAVAVGTDKNVAAMRQRFDRAFADKDSQTFVLMRDSLLDYAANHSRKSELYFGVKADDIAFAAIDLHQSYSALRKARLLVKEARDAGCSEGIRKSLWALIQVYQSRHDYINANTTTMQYISFVRQHLPDNRHYAAWGYSMLAKNSLNNEEYSDAVVFADSCLAIDASKADALFIRACASFSSGDRRLFDASCRMLSDRRYNSNGSIKFFRQYCRIYRLAIDGRTREALVAAQQLATPYNRLLAKLRVCEKAGLWKDVQMYRLQLRRITDRERAELSASDMAEANAILRNGELEMEIERQRIQNTVFAVMGIALFLLTVTAALAIILYRRRRTIKMLDEKNSMLDFARKEAQQASEMKTKFIQNMSHEIRTPLNHIAGFAQILADDVVELDSEQRAEYQKIITEQTTALTTMLNNIIELSSVESCAIPLEQERMNALDFIQTLGKYAEKRKPEVKLSIGTSTPYDLYFTTNRKVLLRIMECLIDNAVKFTYSGEVSINAYSNTHTGDIVITVTDTGIGISPDRANDIFERFYKVNEFIPGFGLGLSIAQAYAKRLGGRIILDTGYKKGGSRFMVELKSRI